MKVWLLTVGEPLPYGGEGVRLLRTGMLAKVLSKKGHDVTWWSSTFDHFAKRSLAFETCTSEWEGGRVTMLHAPTSYRRNVSVSRIRHNIQTATTFRKLLRGEGPLAVPEKPDVIMASFPTIELALEAVRFSRRNGLPIIVDVRDLWPDIFAQAVPAAFRGFAQLALTPFVRQARECLEGATAITAVSDGYLEWGLGYARRKRRSSDRVFPIGYADSAPGELTDKDRTWLLDHDIDADKILVWFVGSFGRSYDLVTVLRAVREIESSGDERFQFVISGDGEARSQLKEEARGLKSVRFTGWVKAEQIKCLQRVAHIGLMAYGRGAAQGLPNKLFEYMAAGLPILSSLEGEGARFIATNQVGFNYPPENSRDLAKGLRRLADSAEERETAGRNGRRLFLAEFDSKIVYENVATYVEEIATNGTR